MKFLLVYSAAPTLVMAQSLQPSLLPPVVPGSLRTLAPALYWDKRADAFAVGLKGQRVFSFP